MQRNSLIVKLKTPSIQAKH